MYGAHYSSLGKASLMITLGLGYIICYLASKSDKTLKKVGYAIGIFIIALSVISMIFTCVMTAKICRVGAAGTMPQGMMMDCP